MKCSLKTLLKKSPNQQEPTEKWQIHPLLENDPLQRQPDNYKSKALLGWKPKFPAQEGMENYLRIPFKL